jgi:hypothetical protein
MTPYNVISWALTLALVWAIIVCILPVEHWIEMILQRGLRDKNLEHRVEELERKIKETGPEKAANEEES